MNFNASRNSEQACLARLFICLLIWMVAGPLLAKPLTDEGTRIKICVINSKNGKPLKNVSISLNGPTGQFLKDDQGKIVTGTTDKLGEVTLQLPSSLPEKVGLFYAGGGACQLVQCSSSQTYRVREILETGLIAGDTCSVGKIKSSTPPPKPGELIIFAKPYSGWQCAMQEVP